MSPIPRTCRTWMRWHHDDMDARSWFDFALGIAFVCFCAWVAGWIVP